MVSRAFFACAVCVFIAGSGVPADGAALGTAFTYQGELLDGGVPVSGQCDFEFTMWDNAGGGAQVGTVVAETIEVVGGRFTTLLDFGTGLFTGEARWLEIEVCCAAPCSPLFTTLSPRQELTPAPYALHAANVPDGHSLDASDGDPVDALYVDADGKIGIGTATPTQALHVLGAVRAELPSPPTPSGSSISMGTPNSNPGLTITRGDGAGNALQRWDVQVEGDRSFQVRNSTGGATRMTITNTGEVGIGTTAPGERLTVAGTVESTSGGFKFPDGSVQATAALGGGANTLDEAYDQGGPGAGRAITADTGPVEIQGTDGLVVSGIVESTTGGFRFPNGSIQTVAATPSVDMQSTVALDLIGTMRWDRLARTDIASDDEPVAMAFDGANVWVANRLNNRIRRFRARDGGVVLPSASGCSEPVALLYTPTHVWAACNATNTLNVYDVETGLLTQTVGPFPSVGAMAYDGDSGHVWVAEPSNDKLNKITATGTFVFDTGTICNEPTALAFDGTRVWVGCQQGVVALRPSDGVVDQCGPSSDDCSYTIDNVTGIASDGVAVWVASSGDGAPDTAALLRIEPSLGTPPSGFTNVVGLHDYSSGLAFDGVHLWLPGEVLDTSGGGPVWVVRLLRVDPFDGSGAVVTHYPVGATPTAVLFDSHNVWIANSADDTVTRKYVR